MSLNNIPSVEIPALLSYVGGHKNREMLRRASLALAAEKLDRGARWYVSEHFGWENLPHIVGSEDDRNLYKTLIHDAYLPWVKDVRQAVGVTNRYLIISQFRADAPAFLNPFRLPPLHAILRDLVTARPQEVPHIVWLKTKIEFCSLRPRRYLASALEKVICAVNGCNPFDGLYLEWCPDFRAIQTTAHERAQAHRRLSEMGIG